MRIVSSSSCSFRVRVRPRRLLAELFPWEDEPLPTVAAWREDVVEGRHDRSTNEILGRGDEN